jgi:hypothetical protein
MSLPNRLTRGRLLALLHRLRSLAHVVEMHQLTNDPERLQERFHGTHATIAFTTRRVAHPAQAGNRVLPVMNGANSHRGVEGVVIERQALGTSSQARRRVPEALRTHERRRFHPEDVAIGGLVRPSARPDVHYGPGIAERSPDARSDARFSARGHGVGGPDGVVQLRAGH